MGRLGPRAKRTRAAQYGVVAVVAANAALKRSAAHAGSLFLTPESARESMKWRGSYSRHGSTCCPIHRTRATAPVGSDSATGIPLHVAHTRLEGPRTTLRS